MVSKSNRLLYERVFRQWRCYNFCKFGEKLIRFYVSRGKESRKMKLVELVIVFAIIILMLNVRFQVHGKQMMIADYFHTSFNSLIRKTLPVLGCFLLFLVPYYYLLRAIPGF